MRRIGFGEFYSGSLSTNNSQICDYTARVEEFHGESLSLGFSVCPSPDCVHLFRVTVQALINVFLNIFLV